MSIKLIAAFLFASAWLLGQSGGYGGPQILSRSMGSTGDRAGGHAGFQYYAGVAGSYETGLVPASVDSSGQIISPGGLYGVIANWGAYGRRTWRHTTFGLDYIGNYRHYDQQTYYDGSDHMLGMQLRNQATRRLQWQWTTSAGTVSRYYIAGPLNSPDLYTSPGYAPFDNRAYILETSAGFLYQYNARLSFQGTGSGFFVRHQSNVLVGLNGWAGQATAAYRLTRNRTIDLSYSRTHFDYPRGFGESDLNTYMVGLTQNVGRRWAFGVSAGAAQVNTTGLEQVAVDPVTAALFGTPVSIQAFNRSVFLGVGRANLRGRFRTSGVEFYYNQSPTGGNGVYLTSTQVGIGGSYTYSGIRRVGLGLAANYNRLSSLGQSLGAYYYFSGGGTASYKLLPSTELTASYDARNIQITQNGFARLSYRFTLGVNFHPSEMPINLW